MVLRVAAPVTVAVSHWSVPSQVSSVPARVSRLAQVFWRAGETNRNEA